MDVDRPWLDPEIAKPGRTVFRLSLRDNTITPLEVVSRDGQRYKLRDPDSDYEGSAHGKVLFADFEKAKALLIQENEARVKLARDVLLAAEQRLSISRRYALVN